MDLENDKIESAFQAPDAYFSALETRILQQLDLIQSEVVEEKITNPPVLQPIDPPAKGIDTEGVQKRARKQDPITSRSNAVNKELQNIGTFEIPALTFTTNENPEWVNLTAISELPNDINVADIQKITFEQPTVAPVKAEEVVSEPSPIQVGLFQPAPILEPSDTVPKSNDNANHVLSVSDEVITEDFSNNATKIDVDGGLAVKNEPSILVHRVPELTPLEAPVAEDLKIEQNADIEAAYAAYLEAEMNEPSDTVKSSVIPEHQPQGVLEEEKTEDPPMAFAPIAGRQHESSTPGWLGIAASFAAIVAAYFIWNAIQPPQKEQTAEVTLQQTEQSQIVKPSVSQLPVASLPVSTLLLESIIRDELPANTEKARVFSLVDAQKLPEEKRQAMGELEDSNLSVFDMEDELFEDLDLETL